MYLGSSNLHCRAAEGVPCHPCSGFAVKITAAPASHPETCTENKTMRCNTLVQEKIY